jgi:DnaD/phage-associated family protein
MILLAAKSVRARGGAFEHLEPKLLSWEEQGLREEGQVLAHLKELKAFEPLLFKAFERAGLDARPGEQDLIRCRKWISEGHSEELILEAASQARSSRQKMAYMEKVLDNWKKSGIRTADEAGKQSAAPAQRRGKRVGFQDYDQGQDNDQGSYTGPDLMKEAREASGQ